MKFVCDRESLKLLQSNKTKRSHTQLDRRKQAIAFWGKVTTTHKGNSTLTKMSKTNGIQIQGNVENFDEIHVLNASVRNRSR